MKKARFSEQQIIEILKLAEAGAKVADLCRKHGICAPEGTEPACNRPTSKVIAPSAWVGGMRRRVML